MQAERSGPRGVKRHSRQLCRAYERILAARFDDDDAVHAVAPYLARALRSAWDLSRGSFLRSALHRVLILHVQLVHVPAPTRQRVDARDHLADAIRDLRAITS